MHFNNNALGGNRRDSEQRHRQPDGYSSRCAQFHFGNSMAKEETELTYLSTMLTAVKFGAQAAAPKLVIGAFYENALKAIRVKVSLMPGKVCTDSVTKWPISASSCK